MSVALLCNDLMSVSQVSGAAARAAERLATFASASALLAAARTAAPRLAIVDLATPGLDLAVLVDELRSVGPQTAIVAFGAHVQAEQLAAARRAGCDRVVTRGQFFGQLDEALRASRASG